MAIKPQYFFIRSIILRNTLIPYDQIMQRRIIGRRQDAQPGPFGIVAAGWIAGLLPDGGGRADRLSFGPDHPAPPGRQRWEAVL